MDVLLEFVIAATFGDICALILIIATVAFGLSMVLYNFLSPIATMIIGKLAISAVESETEKEEV